VLALLLFHLSSLVWHYSKAVLSSEQRFKPIFLGSRFEERWLEPVLAVWLAMLIHLHSSSKTHEEVLPIAPGGATHRLFMWTWKLFQALHKLSITLAKLMTTATRICLLRRSSNAIGCTTITRPLVREEVRQVVFYVHASCLGVAPVVHLTASVNAIDNTSRAEEPAVASVTLVDKRIAASTTLDHFVQVQSSSFAVIPFADI